jgi:pyruvate, water dikinase
VTRCPSRVVIDALALGLGEVVVSGAIEPDMYVVDEDGLRLVSVRVGQQALPFDVDRTEPIVGVELSADEGAQRVLSGDDAVQLARLGVRVEEHYGSTQDMEWLFEGVDVWPYPVIACQVTIGA